MPGAVIIADQTAGAGSGVAGQGRNDLWLTKPIVLTGVLGGNAGPTWSLLAKPPGSAATLSTPTTNVSGFTPDVLGTYRVQFVTNGGGPGNVQILVFRVRFNATGVLAGRGWALPAFGEVAGESNYGGNAAGWAEPLQYIFADILGNAFAAGFVTNPLVANLVASTFKITGLGAPGAGSTDAATAVYAESVATAAAAARQPLNSNLTAIAALTTTTFGLSFLDRADAAAARTLLGLTGSGATSVTVTNVDYSMTALESGNSVILTSGALTGDRALIVDTTLHALAIGDQYVILNGNTGPSILTFKASSSGVGVWIPPTGKGVRVIWTGTDFTYVGDSSGFILQSAQTISQPGGASGPTDNTIWKIPLGWGVSRAVVVPTQIGAGGGSVTSSLETTAGGAELIAAHSPGSSFFSTGTAFGGGAELVANNTLIAARQQNTAATTTDFIESYTVRVTPL